MLVSLLVEVYVMVVLEGVGEMRVAVWSDTATCSKTVDSSYEKGNARKKIHLNIKKTFLFIPSQLHISIPISKDSPTQPIKPHS